MLADESSNSSTSSVSSSRATMFMIDNLLQKDDARYPKTSGFRPSHSTAAPQQTVQPVVTSLSQTSGAAYRQSPPLSETLYRSLNVANSSGGYPEYCSVPEWPTGEAKIGIRQLASQPAHVTPPPDRETLPPKKRLRTDPDKPTTLQDYERSTSPTNSTTSSLGEC